MMRVHRLAWALLGLAACSETHDEGDPSDARASDAAATDAGDAAKEAGAEAGLHWFKTCGAPLCGPSFDGPTGQPRCTSEKVGDTCSSSGTLCDPSLGCAVNLVCAASDPTLRPGGCPISRARFKQDIRYLEPRELSEIAARLLQTPLAEWRYKGDLSPRPQMGFIIEDVEPSPSVEGDQVNLYGYASMAVATLQVQARELRSMRDELSALRARLAQLEQQCPSAPASSRAPRALGSRQAQGRRAGSGDQPNSR